MRLPRRADADRTDRTREEGHNNRKLPLLSCFRRRSRRILKAKAVLEGMMMEEDSGSNSLPDHAIDPSSSRILQSKSIQAEDAAMEEGDEDTNDMNVDEQPTFKRLSAHAARGGKAEYRRIRCPAHRYTPLRESWDSLLTPLVEYLKLQVRFNTRTRSVEMKTSRHTLDTTSLQKGADFISGEEWLAGFFGQTRLPKSYAHFFPCFIRSFHAWI